MLKVIYPENWLNGAKIFFIDTFCLVNNMHVAQKNKKSKLSRFIPNDSSRTIIGDIDSTINLSCFLYTARVIKTVASVLIVRRVR